MPRHLSPELAALAASLMISLGLATLGVAQDAISPDKGAVQHAMPPGGYIGTAALRMADAGSAAGAVQHAMPKGGYIGTAALRPVAVAVACPAGQGAACPLPVQD